MLTTFVITVAYRPQTHQGQATVVTQSMQRYNAHGLDECNKIVTREKANARAVHIEVHAKVGAWSRSHHTMPLPWSQS